MGPLQDALAAAEAARQQAEYDAYLRQVAQQAEFERQYQEVLARQQNATYNRAH